MLDAIKKTLWATADKLRANMDAAEYKHLVLGLIFLKYVSDTFTARRAEVQARLQDPDDEYYYGEASPDDIAAELEDRDYYTSANVFWVPEGARWETLRAAAKQPDIGKRIDDALVLVESENPRLKGILDKRYARAQLPDGKLGELVDLVATIGFGENPSVARDVLGQVYEYFLGQFASAEGKKGGQFYTPASIVKTLVAVLAPHHGKVYDPCCGSGGMFVQSEQFIEAHGGKLGRMISRVQAELDDAAIARIAETVAAWRGEVEEGATVTDYQDQPGFCRSVPLAEIAQHGHVLTPGRYVGAEEVEDDDEAFADKMQKLTEKLGEQMAKGAELDALIRQKLRGLGYEF